MGDITAGQPRSEIKYGTQTLHDSTDHGRHQHRIAYCAEKYKSHQSFLLTWQHATQRGTEIKSLSQPSS